MYHSELRRRSIVLILITLAVAAVPAAQSLRRIPIATTAPGHRSSLATIALTALPTRDRVQHIPYSREAFGGAWRLINNCDMRNRILQRDLSSVVIDTRDNCTVIKGVLHDRYTGASIRFVRGSTSNIVQIDHIVAVADAWQKGGQSLSTAERMAFYNDPLNLIAVEGKANIRKGSSDAADWLPPETSYRCRYVARQIAVKAQYRLWVTKAERLAMQRVLHTCPEQVLPVRADA